MSDKKHEIELIKHKLIERAKELEEKLSALSGEKLTDDEVQDPGDQALSSTMESLRSSFQNSETEEFKRIRKALDQIEQGTYGTCVDCAESISLKRLTIYPTAQRCLACKEMFEDR